MITFGQILKNEVGTAIDNIMKERVTLVNADFLEDYYPKFHMKRNKIVNAFNGNKEKLIEEEKLPDEEKVVTKEFNELCLTDTELPLLPHDLFLKITESTGNDRIHIKPLMAPAPEKTDLKVAK